MSKSKKITLHVSPGFIVPAVYQSSATAEVEQALHLGAILAGTVPSVLAAAKDSEFAELLRQRDAAAAARQAELVAEAHAIRSSMVEAQREIGRLEKKHAATLRETTDALTETLKTEATETQRRAIQEIREQTLQQTQREIATLREQNHVLELRRVQLEKDRGADLERERISIRDSMSLVVAAKQEQLVKTEEMLGKLQEEYRSLNDFLRRKIRSSQEKGAEYETMFRDHLLRAYGAIPKFTIHNGARSSTGHEADFLTTFYDTSILWEVKDYGHKVPTAQIEKFRRDVRENPQVSIAVMLSRTTDITGKTSTGDRHYEFEEGVMYVYISKFEFQGDANDLLQSLRPMFEVWKEIDRDKAAMTAETLVHELQRSVEEAAARRTEWKTHKARLGEAVSWMADYVEKADENVKSLLRRVKGTEKTLVIPEGIFRAVESDRDRETAAAILAVTTPSPDHEIQIKELAKAVGGHLSISTVTATDRIKAILLHLSTPTGKPHTTRGFALCTD